MINASIESHLLNYYCCPQCGKAWASAWNCAVEDDCPACGCRHVSPYRTDDIPLALPASMVDTVRLAVALLNASDAEHPDFLDSTADVVDLLWKHEKLIREAAYQIAAQPAEAAA